MKHLIMKTLLILDIYVKKLNKNEIENFLKYYKYGYNIDCSQIDNLYLVSIIGSELMFDIICETFEITDNKK